MPIYDRKWGDEDDILNAVYDDPNKALKVNIVSGGVVNPTSITHGSVTVSTAGTAVPLATSATPVSKVVTIIADINNTGLIYVGNSSVTNGSGANPGFTLVQGASIDIYIDDLSKIYVDADNSGDKVYFIMT